MYDVIVIGARCAGAPTAMLLARKGYKVLLLDRARFPSEIRHGHFIHRHGPRRLARWGVLDRIVATGCPAVTSFLMDMGDFPLVGRDLTRDGVALGYGPRRAALDNVLLEAAVEAGVELREGSTVDEVVADGDRVAGVRARGRDMAAPVTEHARITVGADGRHSRLAALVHAPVYDACPAVACYYFSYFSDLPVGGLEMYGLRDSVIFAHPTNDALTAVFVGWPMDEFPRVRAGVDAQFMAALDRTPSLAERVRNARRVERFFGAADLPNFYRKPYGPGWALVGDAGCHKDPFLALGICDALRDAELLADAIDDGLTGRRDLEAALAGYEQQRNEASREDYQENLCAARFVPPPDEVFRIRAAIRGNQEATNQFFLAREGMIPREAILDSMAQLAAPAAPRPPHRQQPEADVHPSTAVPPTHVVYRSSPASVDGKAHAGA